MLVPVKIMTLKATRVCKFDRSNAKATSKPPTKNIIESFRYSRAMVSIDTNIEAYRNTTILYIGTSEMSPNLVQHNMHSPVSAIPNKG